MANDKTEALREKRAKRAEKPSREAALAAAALIKFRKYQLPVFWAKIGLLVLHWSRQIGKSYTLAAWAVYRILTNPGRLVTVLSNSKDNGTEFMVKCTEICAAMRQEFDDEDLSPDDLIENMRIECRIKTEGRWGRIKVLAANPRTARGFSGDLILDEFAFHEDSVAIWDAAEPILSSNKDFQCRVASTGNGRWNMFYRMAAIARNRGKVEGWPLSEAGYPVSKVPRSLAYTMGVKIYDTATRGEITPEAARKAALDKRSYDQNYECSFNDEAMALLTLELINAAEYSVEEGGVMECRIDEDDWSLDTLDYLRSLRGPLGLGMDVGRNRNLTSIFVGERIGQITFTRALLRIDDMRLPQQQERLMAVLGLKNFGRGAGDGTGIGLQLCEAAQDRVGQHRFEVVNFASKEKRRVRGVEQSDTALVTELMALDLLQAFEDKAFRIPMEARLRDSLRKPMRVQTGKQVHIAAENDETGHADEFWAAALLQRSLLAGLSGITDIAQVVLGGSRTGVPRFEARRLGGYKRASAGSMHQPMEAAEIDA